CRRRMRDLGWSPEGPEGRAVADPALAEALGELSTTLEELQVADEELHAQNETLREARDTLEAERERYRSLFDFAPDAYLVTDGNGLVLEANRAALAMLNLSLPLFIGKPLAVYIGMPDRKSFRERLDRAQDGSVENWEMELSPRGSPDPLPVEARVR